MQTLHVNGTAMAYLEVGRGPPLVCVHGALDDFRSWSALLGPLSKKHRVIAVSLRHCFPEHWDGGGDTYSIAQHVADLIAFIEQLDVKPVDLMGHSRGGHISVRLAQRRPDLLRKLVLVEPGGDLDASLDPAAKRGPSQFTGGFTAAAERISAGDIDGGMRFFFDTVEGDGAWAELPEPRRQQLRDNAFTLVGQIRDKRPPYSRLDAEQIRMPTLFIGGADTRGTAAAGAARAGGPRSGFEKGDDCRRQPLDVRAGAATILRDRAGVFGGVIARNRSPYGAQRNTGPASRERRPGFRFAPSGLRASMPYGFHTPAGCLVATLSRFQTLILAIAISNVASASSS